MVEKRSINAADVPDAEGGYCQAIEISNANRTLYVSGQIPVDLEGKVPEAFLDQARLVWRNVEAQLRAADMSLDNLVKVTIFLSDRQFSDENRAVRREVLGERTPALTVIITGIFDPAWLLEIEAIASA
jgi:enamine deaminase RidA (YjgF/YER057c/UK114 family)